MSGRLTWKDAVAAWLIAWLGAAVIAAALLQGGRQGAFPSFAGYAVHLWLFAVSLFWFFALRRRFPVGSFAWRELRPWAWSWLVAAVVLLAAAPFMHGGTRPSLPALMMALIFVGPSEEFPSRGVVQTGLNNSIRWSLSIRSVRVNGGTLLASAMFGLAHLVNLTYQPIGETLPQVAGAAALGLVIGLLYDRYPNLWGASILHDVIDGLQAVTAYV